VKGIYDLKFVKPPRATFNSCILLFSTTRCLRHGRNRGMFLASEDVRFF
jgi:hypothetical protein